MKPKLVIFDFDGTIADTLNIVFETVNDLSEEFNYQKIRPDRIHELKALGTQYLLQSLGISKLRLPFFVNRVREELNKKIPTVKPIQGMPESLNKLSTEGYYLGIVTSNSKNNVDIFLEKNNLKIFNFASYGVDLFGKENKIRSMIKKAHMNTDDSFYIGDETRDIESSKKVGVKIISVTWGYNSRELLEKFEPDYLIEKPKDLLKLLIDKM